MQQTYPFELIIATEGKVYENTLEIEGPGHLTRKPVRDYATFVALSIRSIVEFFGPSSFLSQV